MKYKLMQWSAITLILEIGLIHILLAQSEYEEAHYMGYLFAANFFGALLAAAAIWRGQFWGWLLGLVIAFDSMVGYAWSRTLGMPGMAVEEWYNPLGIIALSLEGALIGLVALQLWKFPADRLRPAEPSKLRHLFPAASLGLMVLISTGGYVWNDAFAKDLGHHVASLDEVCRTRITLAGDLNQQYGIAVSLVAVSMMDSVVDVRLKILDPVKAQILLQNQAALLLNQEALILAPHMHSHVGTRLKAGKIYSVFFPTEQKIHRGSQVSLVFGPVRFESMVVQ